LLRTSDETLTASDIALGYKTLYEVERGWRDTKSTIDLRPVYHRKEERIAAHVQLCWLALLVLRVAEVEVGDTSRNIRNELDRMHLVALRTSVTTLGLPAHRTHRRPRPYPHCPQVRRTAPVLRLHPGPRNLLPPAEDLRPVVVRALKRIAPRSPGQAALPGLPSA
jgi:hypothetical protein